MSSGSSDGSSSSMSATMPLTTAAAWLVPDIVKPFPCARTYSGYSSGSQAYDGITPSMWPPGATMSGLTKPSTVGPADENCANLSSPSAFGVYASV